jgi:Flp pilus assembly protein TadG
MHRHCAKPGRAGRRDGRRGSQVVESMLIILPLLALVMLIIDTSWGLFVRATIQYAVQAGADYAATGGTSEGGQLAGIQAEVKRQASGLLADTPIDISFFAPADTGTPLGTGAGVNAAGNIVQIQVTYPFAPLAPLFRSGATINLSASAASVLTATPTPGL